MNSSELNGRHPSVKHRAKFLLDVNPSLKGKQRQVADWYAELTEELLEVLPDSPSLTDALADLTRSKDNAVRASL